ncbi:MAG: response regulator [Desulfobacteraceae bacterium]|nr:response regulator [Desulfobacteraceae bacterium]
MTAQPLTILIVDDEQRFLESMRKLLRRRGINVIAAETGDKAVRMARGYPVDAALVDIKMPGMGGLATMQALKSDNPDLEVIIISGQASDELDKLSMEKGAFMFLEKPCSLEQIMDAIVNVLRKTAIRKCGIDEQQLDRDLEAAGCTSPPEIMKHLKTILKESAEKRD